MQEVRTHKALLDTKPRAMAMFARRIPHYLQKWNNNGTLKDAFYKWYVTIAFMSFSNKGNSANEMQRQLGHK